jgi:hypothetical protein
MTRAALVAALLALAPFAHAEGQNVNAYVASSTVSGSETVASTTRGFVENEVSGYATAVVQFTSVGSGNTVTFEGSNDNATWFTLPGYTLSGAAHTGAVSPSTSVANVVQLTTKYFRARLSTYSAGTVAATVTYKATQSDPSIVGAPTVVGGNVASGATDSGNPVKVGCKFNSTRPTFTDGQRGDCQIDTRGNLAVCLSTDAGSSCNGAATLNTDGNAAAVNGIRSGSFGFNYNSVTWDREFTCSNSAPVNVTAAATTQLVALASSQVIRVCSFVITESLAGTAKFVYGTGANCATGTTDITGAMVLATNASIQLSAVNGSLFRTAASNALCLAAVTGNITGFVTYAQY